MCTVALNNDLNGVELYFNSKPEMNILESLKSTGFRWHKVKKCWYAKQNQRTMAIADQLGENEINSEISENKNTISENYYPNYSSVGNVAIYKTSDVSILSNRHGYYADINAYVYFYDDSCSIIDLTNAMKNGQQCKKYSARQIEWTGRNFCDFYNLIHKTGIEKVNEFYNHIVNDNQIDGIEINQSELKSSKVFSPFVEVKPIKTPTKWTKSHVWKAILSGQIYSGQTDYHYTDDYAYDAAYNYREGCGVDLIRLAQDLIEDSCSGYSFFTGEEKDGVIPVSVSTYSFDCKTLMYDENCNNETKFEKLQQIQDEKNKKNRDLKAKVIPLEKTDINQTSIYDIEYLEMNSNTDLYEIKKKKVHAKSLFYEDENTTECNYEIISIDPMKIDNHSLYSVKCYEKDKRLIDIGEHNLFVTGYALQEMLYEGVFFESVSKSGFTFESAREQCNKFMNGTIMLLFVEDKTDYAKAILQLNTEELRIPEDDVLCLTL